MLIGSSAPAAGDYFGIALTRDDILTPPAQEQSSFTAWNLPMWSVIQEQSSLTALIPTDRMWTTSILFTRFKHSTNSRNRVYKKVPRSFVRGLYIRRQIGRNSQWIVQIVLHQTTSGCIVVERF
jgi:hypothetical protein